MSPSACRIILATARDIRATPSFLPMFIINCATVRWEVIFNSHDFTCWRQEIFFMMYNLLRFEHDRGLCSAEYWESSDETVALQENSAATTYPRLFAGTASEQAGSCSSAG